MFKSKKIVALVLCAMMLFVPVAAAAATLNEDFLYQYASAVVDAEKAANLIAGKIKGNDQAVSERASAAMEQKVGDTVWTLKTRGEQLDEAVKDYQKTLKDAKDAVAKAESLRATLKQFSLAKFFTPEKTTGVLADGPKFTPMNKDDLSVPSNSQPAVRPESDARDILKNADKKLAEVKNTIGIQEAEFAKVNENVKLAKAILPIYEKALAAGTDKNAAVATIESLAPYYAEGQKAEIRQLVAPQILKAWKVFVANASEYEKASFYNGLSDEVKELVGKAETKYEVMSTGEKGWILSDEAKNGCLKDVAEFKVEKKDGKFVAKVYGKDGKEMKIGQQLTVYRPIGKDVKVLKAKVDGKDVTFSVGLRNGQNYVSVPVIY